MKIAPPLAPRIAKALESWPGAASDVVEIDRNMVEGADFVGATKISADASRIESGILTGLSLDKLEMSNVEMIKLEAAANGSR